MLDLIRYLNTLPPELIWLVQLLICYGSALLMLRLFGANGLYTFIALIIIAANLQVLKIVQFSVFTNPVALGTVSFTSAYLATDILTEYYGAAAARKGVLLGFVGLLLFLIFMILTMGYHPLSSQPDIQRSMLSLFAPIPALLAASLISFLMSQFFDIWIFKRIREVTGQSKLWLRNNVSTILAALVDNIVFSLFAWRIFASTPMAWHKLIFTYILGTYLIRVVIAILDTPFIYLAKYFLPHHERADTCKKHLSPEPPAVSAKL